MRKVRWGVLSTAKIAVDKVVPAMRRSGLCEVTAIASRDLGAARAAAAALGIPRAYGAYDEILADPDVEAIYNPLPNHLHAPWSIAALRAGKHVLCEKPVALTSAEARAIADAARARPPLLVMEAFMYRHHPQWQRARALTAAGALGDLRAMRAFFSYYNVDPANIRNQVGAGGGALMDIGCYGVSSARFLFGREPERVFGVVERDPGFGTDRLTSAILDFATGTATFTCATQTASWQKVDVVGAEGILEIEIPFNPPPDRPARMWHRRGATTEEITLDACDAFTLQADAFSRAILDGLPAPFDIDDAIANMVVIEAIFDSAQKGAWARLEPRPRSTST
jgi:predicted dehydrogenase